VLAVAAGALAAAAPDAAPSPDSAAICETVERCIALLTDTGQARSVPHYRVADRFHELGSAGAEALVGLLDHPSGEVRRRASRALEKFEALDPRHTPALIAAHRRGLEVEEAIARTGSDEALRYLQSAWTTGEDDNHRARSALPMLGRAAEPFLLRELARCRSACSRREAQQILYALGRIGPLPDEAMAIVREVATAESTEPQLRLEMEDALIDRRDPLGLPFLVRRLEAVRGTEYENWTAARLLEEIYQYDEAAQAPAGALILHYLTQRDLRVARTAAAVAAWSIQYRPAIPVLRAALADADRDWLFAYQALAALAELGGREARPEIARLARGHWYRPVRNSARRALRMLDGGPFELPEVGAKDQRGPFAGELNFAADLDAVLDCRFDRAVGKLTFGRGAPVRNGAPRHRAIRIDFDPPSPEASTAAKRSAGSPPPGLVTLDWNRGTDRILGIDAGRWEGGLFVVDPNGDRRRVLAANVLAAFYMADNLFVITGDSSHRFDDADLWRLKAAGPLAVADGPLRLPASPTGYALASDRTLLIRTQRGDVALTPRGRLLPPRSCPGAAPRG
jgi:hypothetical protein